MWHEAEADRKAIAAQINLITLNRQDKMASDFGKPEEVTYNFTDGKKIKALYLEQGPRAPNPWPFSHCQTG